MTRSSLQPGPATDHYHDTFGVEETVPSTSTPSGASVSVVSVHDSQASRLIPFEPGEFNANLYSAPENDWEIDRDDVGAVSEDDIVLPEGFWLCGGYLDTTNDWQSTPDVTGGWVSVWVQGGSYPNFPFVVVQEGGMASAHIIASIPMTPALIRTNGSDSIAFKARNRSDRAIQVSGVVFWAIKVA